MALTDRELRSIKPKEKPYRISVDQGGARQKGKLIVEIHPKGTKHFFFQYIIDGKRTLVKVGEFATTKDSTGITLAEAKEKILPWQNWVADGLGVKEQIIAEENKQAEIEREAREKVLREKLEQEEQHRREKLARQEERRRGNFCQLLFCYVAMMRADGKTSWDQVRKDLYRYVVRPHPALVQRKAFEITDEDITFILSEMIGRGVTTKTNRIRSYLHRAFNIGIKSERDPLMRAKTKLSFKIKFNPVTPVPRQDSYERIGERYLSDEEIKTVWLTIEERIGLIPASAIKFGMATSLRAGHEILTLKWSYLNKKEKYLEILKTKNNKPHILPLNDKAMEVLAKLEPLTGKGTYIFAGGASVDPSTYFRTDSLGNVLAQYCIDTGIEKFVPRDIRRTVKTHMGKAGIDKLIRDKLQNHSENDVSSKHYDRYDYLKEKRLAVASWDAYLEGIINPASNVVHIKKSTA